MIFYQITAIGIWLLVRPPINVAAGCAMHEKYPSLETSPFNIMINWFLKFVNTITGLLGKGCYSLTEKCLTYIKRTNLVFSVSQDLF